MNKKKKLVLIDGHAIIFRAYYALPPLTAPDGMMVNAVFGFSSMLLKIYEKLEPDYLAVCFDVAGDTFRNEVYKDYKANRSKADDELIDQFPLVYDVVNHFGIPIYEQVGFEADDVIGTISKQVIQKEKNLDVVIVTGDKDILQLIDTQRIQVAMLGRGVSDFTLYDEAAVIEKFGFIPEKIIDYKAFMGDPSDNIPGVKGIGKKTAAQLLMDIGTVDEVYEHIKQFQETDKCKIKSSVVKKLLSQEKEAYMSRELATIICDVQDLDFSLSKTVTHDIPLEKVKKLFTYFGFQSLIRRLPSSEVEENPVKKVIMKPVFQRVIQHVADGSNLEKTLLEDLKANTRAVCFVENAEDQRFILATEKTLWNCSLENVELLEKIFVQKDVQIIGHDLKFFLHMFVEPQKEISTIVFDIMIASYILKASSRAHGLKEIFSREREIELTEETPLNEIAEVFFSLQEDMAKELQEAKQQELFEQIEMKLIPILAKMEHVGMLVDTVFLKKLSTEVHKHVDEITKNIYKFAGKEFNIASSKQMREVLFDELKLPTLGIKKGKTGYSTAASELEKLRGTHKIIEHIEQFRESMKLLQTYIDVLPELVDTDSRIHTSFNQTVAATGRLSSSDPNLQNIPVRSENGRKIREAFVAPTGYTLVAADYSQIELRIVASLANDKELINIFQEGLDVHTATAARIHGVPLEEVTPELRFSAKEVNFGVLYGMGSFGLSSRTGISQKQAKQFIENYFQNFSGVKTYLNEVVAKTKKEGYSETLFGRRRYIPEINSNNAQLRNAGERMAINMPVQGTQADIIKLAMIAVEQELLTQGLVQDKSVQMLLQVHDELMFEVKDTHIEKVSELIRKKMESVALLAVPILVGIKTGKNWGSLS